MHTILTIFGVIRITEPQNTESYEHNYLDVLNMDSVEHNDYCKVIKRKLFTINELLIMDFKNL